MTGKQIAILLISMFLHVKKLHNLILLKPCAKTLEWLVMGASTLHSKLNNGMRFQCQLNTKKEPWTRVEVDDHDQQPINNLHGILEFQSGYNIISSMQG